MEGWEQAVQDFLESGLSAATRNVYQGALQRFRDWYCAQYGSFPDIRGITEKDLWEYRAYLASTGSPATVNQHLSALRSLLRHAGRTVKVPGIPGRPLPVRTLSDSDIARLLEALGGRRWLSQRDRAIVALMVHAGLRVGEIVAARMEDLLENGWMTVRGRRVPLGPALPFLQAYLEVRPRWDGPLFLSRTGSPMRARDVQRIVAEASRRAGLEPVATPRVLRHTFAIQFLRSGGDPAELQRILGHLSSSPVNRYSRMVQNTQPGKW